MQKKLLNSLLGLVLLAMLFTSFTSVASAHSNEDASHLRSSIASVSVVPCLPSYNKVALQDSAGNWHCWGYSAGEVYGIYLRVEAIHSDNWSGYLYDDNNSQMGYFCNGENAQVDYGINNPLIVKSIELSPVKIPEC